MLGALGRVLCAGLPAEPLPLKLLTAILSATATAAGMHLSANVGEDVRKPCVPTASPGETGRPESVG